MSAFSSTARTKRLWSLVVGGGWKTSRRDSRFVALIPIDFSRAHPPSPNRSFGSGKGGSGGGGSWRTNVLLQGTRGGTSRGVFTLDDKAGVGEDPSG